jgi:hypothetical protein
MTMRDPEVLDVLRDEPELLALADALADTQRQPSQRVRRLAPRLGAVAAVAAGIAAAVLLWPSGSGTSVVLGRALAAIGDGRVLHLVLEQPLGETLVDLRTGHRTTETARLESWTDHDFRRAHIVMRVRGQVGDVVLPENAAALGPVDPAYVAFWTGYREALAKGDAKLEGEDSIDGRPVYWLRFPPVDANQPGTLVAIDRATYKPVVIRHEISSDRHYDVRVLVAETTPYRPADFERIGPDLFEGSVSSSSGSVRPATLDEAEQAPWLTLGSRVPGLELEEVSRTTTRTRGKTIDGIDLVYRGDRGSLTIHELSQPDEPLTWKHIPRSSIGIQEGEGGDQNGSSRTWTGNLVKSGVYLTIETGAGEDAVLEAARALRPAR